MQTDIKVSETELLYTRLMACSGEAVNDHLLATIISHWATDKGCLPRWLGLDEQEYRDLFLTHFAHYGEPVEARPGETLERDRIDERDEVYALLLAHRAGVSHSETWLAKIVTSACQGQDHLWQDLGVWSRKDLSDLLSINFPALASKNDRDMKWKKFIYKQLCIAEGIYVCRAPSCEVCIDYANCFGPED